MSNEFDHQDAECFRFLIKTNPELVCVIARQIAFSNFKDPREAVLAAIDREKLLKKSHTPSFKG